MWPVLINSDREKSVKECQLSLLKLCGELDSCKQVIEKRQPKHTSTCTSTLFQQAFNSSDLKASVCLVTINVMYSFVNACKARLVKRFLGTF